METELIQRITILYDLPNLRYIEKAIGGYLTDNYILTNTDEKFFLKRYRYPDEEKIKKIQSVKKYYHANGVPVIIPLLNNKQSAYFIYKEGYFSLFPFVEGQIYKSGELNEIALESAGAMLAQIHKLGKDTGLHITEQSRGWNKQRFFECASQILDLIQKKEIKDSFDVLAEKIILLKLELAENNTVNFLDLNMNNDHIIHGDYQVNNLFFDKEDKVKYVFDWEKTELAPRSTELLRSIAITCFNTQYEDKNYLDAEVYLKSYNKFYPISKLEVKNAVTLIHIKHIHSLWVETEHYLKNNGRVDIFLQKSFDELIYLTKSIDLYINRLSAVL